RHDGVGPGGRADHPIGEAEREQNLGRALVQRHDPLGWSDHGGGAAAVLQLAGVADDGLGVGGDGVAAGAGAEGQHSADKQDERAANRGAHRRHPSRSGARSRSPVDRTAVAVRASRSSDSGSSGRGAFPDRMVQWRRAPPVTLTAARQSRSLTGFPGSSLSLTGEPTIAGSRAPTAGRGRRSTRWHHNRVTERTRRDLCPGLLRPWIADDGALVRVRVPGGQLSALALQGLLDVATTYGDGTVHLTSRANLQVRAI